MSAHLIVYAVLVVLILGLGRGDLIWFRQKAETERAKAISQRDDAREACRQAEVDLYRVAQERDAAVREVAKLLGQDDEATVRLPKWADFLDPQAAHDKAVTDLMEQQFSDPTGGDR